MPTIIGNFMIADTPEGEVLVERIMKADAALPNVVRAVRVPFVPLDIPDDLDEEEWLP